MPLPCCSVAVQAALSSTPARQKPGAKRFSLESPPIKLSRLSANRFWGYVLAHSMRVACAPQERNLYNAIAKNEQFNWNCCQACGVTGFSDSIRIQTGVFAIMLSNLSAGSSRSCPARPASATPTISAKAGYRIGWPPRIVKDVPAQFSIFPAPLLASVEHTFTAY